MKTLIGILAVVAATGIAPSGFRTQMRQERAAAQPQCLFLTNADTRVLLGSAIQFATDTTSGGARASQNVPLIHADSIQIISDSTACAKADSTYRVWRVNKGSPNVDIKIALARLGSSGYYFGTSFIGEAPNEREFVLLNSSFSVIADVVYVFP